MIRKITKFFLVVLLFIVIVKINAQAQCNITVTKPVFCKGVPDSIFLSVSGPVVACTYSWYVNNVIKAVHNNLSKKDTLVYAINANSTLSVKIKDANNCTDSTAKTLYVDSMTVAAILNGSINNSEVCLGTPIDLNSSFQYGIGTKVYSWTGPLGFTSALANPASFTAVANTNGYYVVNLSDNNGCSVKDSVAVLNVLSNPTITPTVNDNTPCLGGSLDLNSTPAGGSGSYSSFSWSGPAFVSSSQNPASFAAASGNTGTYTVTVTDNKGCTGSGTLSLTVDPAVGITAFANTSSVPISLCEGNAVDLNSTPSGGNGNYVTFLWSGPNGYSDPLQNPLTFNTVLASGGSYTVTVTDQAGCTASDAISVTVTPGATVNPGTNQSVCGTDTVFLAGSFGGSADSTDWTSSSHGVFGNPNNTSTYYIPDPADMNGGTDTLTLTTNDPAGPCPLVSAYIVITFSVPVTMNVDNNKTICEGDTVFISGSSITGGIATGTWSTSGNGTFLNASTINNNYYLPGTADITAGFVDLTLTSGNPAGPCPSVSGSFHVIIHAKPVVTITSAGSFCLGDTIKLNSQPAGGASPYAYTWSGPSGFNAATQNAIIANATSVNAGIYTVNITDNNGCKNKATKNITVNALPSVTVTSAGTFCLGDTIKLNSQPSGGASPYSYAWSGPSGFNAATQNAIIANAASVNAGIYTINITDNNGCKNKATKNISVSSLPAVTVTSGGTFCVGDTIKLNSQPSGGTAPYLFNWNGPSGFNANTQNTSVANCSSVNAGNYTVIITDSNGCKNNATKNILINALPPKAVLINPSALDFTLCNGTKNYVILVNSNAGTHFHWISNIAQTLFYYNNGDSSAVNISFQNTTTSYQNIITIQSTDSITQCHSDTSISIFIDGTNAAPDTLLIAYKTLGNTLLALDNTVNFYQWGYDDLKLIPHKLTGEVYQSYSAGDSFNLSTKYYWVITGYADSCSTKSYYNNPYKKGENFIPPPLTAEDASMVVAPNPSNGTFTATVRGDVYGNISMTLSDIYGRVLARRILNKDEFIQRYSFQFLSIEGGLYLINLTGLKNEKLTQKLFIK